MKINNIEFKASVDSLEAYEKNLLKLSPEFKGIDHQIDTYFKVDNPLLKLREGNIENALIQYSRPEKKGIKHSEILLYQHQPSDILKQILIDQLGIKVIVDKTRKIYFIGNTKFHFDRVKSLGNFIEVEVIDETGKISLEELQEKCKYFQEYLGVKPSQFQELSYSAQLINRRKG